MAEFTQRQVLGAGAFSFSSGLRDLAVSATGGSALVYAATLTGGGVTAFRVTAGGELGTAGSASYPGALATGVVPRLANLTSASPDVLLVSGRVPGGPALTSDGAAGAWTTLPGYGQSLIGAGTVQIGAREFLLSGTPSGGIVALEVSGGSLLQRGAVSGFAASGFVQTASGQVVAVSPQSDAVALLAVSPTGTLTLGPVVEANDGIGWSAPTALATLTVGGEAYVIVGSAGSSSLTVLAIRQGSFIVADHVIDDLGTRFQALADVAVLEVGGRAFVAAGGGDDGVSLFELLPGGRLVHQQTIVDSTSITLANVTSVALAQTSTNIILVAASESEPGLTVFTRALSGLAAPILGGAGADTLTGSAKDDLILGEAGDDILSGGAGDDIIRDGSGSDRMSGGTGRDTFVLTADGEVDRITDFETGIDRLDLSGFAVIRSVADLTVTPTAGGARIVWGGEVLEITTSSGRSLTAADFGQQDILGLTRPPEVFIGRVVDGVAGNDVLDGSVGGDRVRGFAGDDALSGQGGHDMLLGGPGSDQLSGDDGSDRIDGGADGDALAGGSGSDILFGGTGDDTLAGGEGADLLVGGAGADTLAGGAGHDVLRGGSGDDALDGGEGNDRLLGGEGNDTLDGGAGRDWLDGGPDNDWLTGGAEADTFVFVDGFGSDTIADFDPLQPGEVVDLSRVSGLTGWGDLSDYFTDTPAGALLDLGQNGQILLEGLALADLAADDFLF